MKVLLINCVYGSGSTGKIVADLVKYGNQEGHEFRALYGRLPYSSDKFAFKISSELEAKSHSLFSRFTGQHFAYSPIATHRVLKYIRLFNPDIVHLHCLNANFVNVYSLLNFLKSNDYKTVLTLHAEIMHTAGCEHAIDCNKWISGCYKCNTIKGLITHHFRDDAAKAFKRMEDALSNFKNLTVVGVSEWLTSRARQSGVFAKCSPRFASVHNGCDLTEFTECEASNNGRKRILHVTPNFRHPIKGGEYVLQLAKSNPDWDFLIVGDNGKTVNDIPDNLRFLSRVSNKRELSKIYSSSDVTVLTSKRETFSMVCLESLCCGTPVVEFCAGGPESVFKMDGVLFVPFGDLRAMTNAIKKTLIDTPRINSQVIKSEFSSKRMYEDYYDIYVNM